MRGFGRGNELGVSPEVVYYASLLFTAFLKNLKRVVESGGSEGLKMSEYEVLVEVMLVEVMLVEVVLRNY